jgi:hypothetical protein
LKWSTAAAISAKLPRPCRAGKGFAPANGDNLGPPLAGKNARAPTDPHRPPDLSTFVIHARPVGIREPFLRPGPATMSHHAQGGEVDMSRSIWFVLGIIGLIAVIIWVVNRV